MNRKYPLLLILFIAYMSLFGQSAQFVIDYSYQRAYEDANVSDAIITASYLLKNTREEMTLKNALKIFEDNKITLNFSFCKNKNQGLEQCLNEKLEKLNLCKGKEKEMLKCMKEKKLDTSILLDRTVLSYIFFKALRLKGGVTTRIFGVTPRYAYKELIYLGFFRGGFSKQYVTRIEVLNTLTNALEYIKKREKPKKEEAKSSS